MAKQYPHAELKKQKRWAELAKAGKPTPQCRADGCTAGSLYRVDIEVNWFRGEDIVTRACEAHKKDIPALIRGEDKRSAMTPRMRQLHGELEQLQQIQDPTKKQRARIQVLIEQTSGELTI